MAIERAEQLRDEGKRSPPARRARKPRAASRPRGRAADVLAVAAAPPQVAPAQVDHLVVMMDYVRQVADGSIYVAESTREAARRHLEDLERQGAPDFPYRFDDVQARRAIRFCHLLRHVKGDLAGKLLVLEPFALFVVASLFGWRRVDGGRRYRKALIWMPRGNAKSTLLSACSLYAAFAEGGQADVYSLATTKEQAGICWGDAASMLRVDQALRDALGVEVLATALVQESTNSSFRRLASKDTSLDGLNVSWANIDELHEVPQALWDVIETALAKRANSILVSISTAGNDGGSFGREQYRYCRQVLAGDVRDDQTFVLIYECPEGADPYSVEAQRAAIPMFGLSVRPEILAAAADKARRFPHARAGYLVKHLNVWLTARSAFFNMRKWEEMADRSLTAERLRHLPCWIGLDLASRKAFACAAKLFSDLLPHRDPGRAAAGEAERHWYLLADCWINEEAVEASPTDSLKSWAAEGFIQVTPGNVTDYGFIQKQLLEDVAQLRVQELVTDPYEAEMLIQKLGPGVEVVLYPQRTANLSPPMKELAAALDDGRFHHNGNPAVGFMFGNVTAKEDANENVHPRKESESSYIDAASATLNALGRAMVGAGQPSGYSAARGLRFI